MIIVDPASPLPVSEQIRERIADLARSGALAAGHRLPAIRQLAADLQVAPGTVAKAYAALEAEALVETSRTRGTRIAARTTRSERVNEAARAYLLAVDGVGLDEALSAVRAAWAERRA